MTLVQMMLNNYNDMTSDQNKGITNITDNHLILPKKISFVGNNVF
jgi:hypothetical protein